MTLFTLSKRSLITLTITLLAALLAFTDAPLAGESPLTIAVTSNALGPIKKVAEGFEKDHATRIRIVSGSTGKLFTQITQGAPFDVFIAADVLRPRLLEERGLIKKGSRFTYARGVLVIWSNGKKGLVAKDFDLKILKDSKVRRIAIANPDIAPYGKAALEALNTVGFLEEIREKFIYGENVSHAFNFARTGNADLAITALSTIHGQPGKHVEVKSSLYQPITQQAVVLKDAHGSATSFAEYLKGKKGREILRTYGYSLP